MHLVEHATDSDLEAILAWLKIEYSEDNGEGFWNNRALIERNHRHYRELFVTREAGEAVSFHLGQHAPSIVSTRKDRRGRGHAEAHLVAAIARCRTDNVNILDIECEPRSSWAFWQKRGFVRYGNMSDWGQITARMVLETRHTLPQGPRGRVLIEFFPEEASYKEGIDRLYGWSIDAALLPDGSYQLPERLFGHSRDIAVGRDLVVRVTVDDHMLYFDKAKYDEAEALGVKHDLLGDCFFLDRICPPHRGGYRKL